MWNVLTVLGVALAVILLEMKHLRYSWKRKEKVVFFISLSLGTITCIFWMIDVKLINPIEIIEDIYRPLSQPLSLYLRQFH